jgi:hypothetical protein
MVENNLLGSLMIIPPYSKDTPRIKAWQGSFERRRRSAKFVGYYEIVVYTCYEMIQDCRANVAEGWSYFLVNYVPVIRRLIAHYASERTGDELLLEQVLGAVAKPDSILFKSLEPAPERWFVAELRQKVLAELDASPPEIAISLAAVGEALAPLSVTEKQAAWLEGMRYTAEQTVPMLRVSAATVDKIRGQAAELLRERLDVWRRTVLAENGLTLGREAARAGGQGCPDGKAFLDILDGRTTWQGRGQMEQHVSGCWHCVDHFCRMLEVLEVMRGNQPLEAGEAGALRTTLGLPEVKRTGWRRIFSAR